MDLCCIIPFIIYWCKGRCLCCLDERGLFRPFVEPDEDDADDSNGSTHKSNEEEGTESVADAPYLQGQTRMIETAEDSID